MRRKEDTMELTRIAVVQGASNASMHWSIAGIRPRDWLVFSRKPMVSPTGLAAPDFSAIFAPANDFPFFRTSGPGSTACHLDGVAIIPATEAVQRGIAAGCDLVLLKKFGKLEAANSGLADAFRAAIEADVPVLTSVSPAHEAAWVKFATPLFITLPADPLEIDAWWQAVR
jgi:hypothetical protein